MIDEKSIEKIIEYLKSLIAQQPWAIFALCVVIVGGIAWILFSLGNRIRRGDELKIWKIEFKPNKMFDEQNKVIEKLDEDSRQKGQIIKLIDQINLEISRALSSSSIDLFHKRKSDTYRLVLHGIGTILTKKKSNSHRVAIFVDDDLGNLMIRESAGFSSEGKEKLRLSIQDSAAGRVYRTGETYNDNNLLEGSGKFFKPHPQASRKYCSLLCVPIKCGEHIIGVLSIDGQEENSFDKDDEDYLKYFANVLSVLMYFDKVVLNQEGVGDSDAKSGREEKLA